MKKLLSLSVVSLLVGCATSGTQMQADCEEKYMDFTEIYQCTYESIVAKNPKILKDPMAKLYMLRGEQLALAVTRQQISSLDAKVEWQKQFLEMKRMKEQEVGLALQAISAMPQPQPQRETMLTPAIRKCLAYGPCESRIQTPLQSIQPCSAIALFVTASPAS